MDPADPVADPVDQVAQVVVVREVVDRVDLGVAHQVEVAAVVGKRDRQKGGLLVAIEVLVVRVVRGAGQVGPKGVERSTQSGC